MRRFFQIMPLLAMALLASCGDSGPSLDGRVMQLAVVWDGRTPVEATLRADPGGATAGAQVSCRMTGGDGSILGRATADSQGAFLVTLDPSGFPDRLPDAAEYETFNELVECRPGDGRWTHPLKPPSIALR
jgi:hypothetical protein